jgi:hypothetical protein
MPTRPRSWATDGIVVRIINAMTISGAAGMMANYGTRVRYGTKPDVPLGAQAPGNTPGFDDVR